jgi:Uma2 family endonuclease
MTTQVGRITVEEFEALPDDEQRHELVRGELRTMPPSKGDHGFVEFAVLALIDRYIEARAVALGWDATTGDQAERDALVGRVGSGDVGLTFALPDDLHQIRGADGVYVAPDQLAGVQWAEGEYFPGVPALVIEVVSKTDRADHIAEKVQDYLAGGARRVWVLYPRQRAIHVHDADRPTRVVRGTDSLTDDELFPGLVIPLARVFGHHGGS